MSLFEKHKNSIDAAVKALHDRTFYAAFPEHPSPKVYGETADADETPKFKSFVGKNYEELEQNGEDVWAGDAQYARCLQSFSRRRWTGR